MCLSNFISMLHEDIHTSSLTWLYSNSKDSSHAYNAYHKIARNTNVGSLDLLNIFCQYTLSPTSSMSEWRRCADVWHHVDSGWYEMMVLVFTPRTMWIARRSM